MKGKLSRADVQQLHELGAMKNKGILTAEEFATLKIALLEDHRTRQMRRPAVWFVAAGVALVLIVAAVDTSSGGSAAHGVGQAVAAAQH